MHKISYDELSPEVQATTTREEWEIKCAEWGTLNLPEQCQCGQTDCDCWMKVLEDPAQFRQSSLVR